jgi:uncharacterized phage protein gp47/JayE
LASNISAFIQLYGDYSAPAFWANYGVQSTGFVMPAFTDVIQREIDVFRASFQGLNEDIDIDPSSPEGQYIYGEAKDKYALLLQAQAVYNSMNLLLSSGNALERNLQYIGTKKIAESKSTAQVIFSTTDGVTPITLETGYPFQNTTGKDFVTTASITFASTSSPVTAEAVEYGAIDVSEGALSVLTAPRANLASVTNPTDGITGLDAESDPEARQRGGVSSSINAKSTTDAVLSQLRNLSGVLQATCIENKSDSMVASVQPHAVRYIVYGGATNDIGTVLYKNEVPGIPYVGNAVTTESYTKTEADGIQTTVYFDRPIENNIYIKIPITTQSFNSAIITALLAYAVNRNYGITIGEDVVGNKFYGTVYQVLIDNNKENSEEVGDIQVSFDGATWYDRVPIDADRIGVLSSARISFVSFSV